MEVLFQRLKFPHIQVPFIFLVFNSPFYNSLKSTMAKKKQRKAKQESDDDDDDIDQSD